MRLITDIDSTLNDHWRRIRRNTNPWPGGGTSGKAFTREEVMLDKPLPYCRTALNAIQGKGYEVSYLSARGWPDAQEITQEWLALHGFPNPTEVRLVRSMREKLDVLNELRPEFYVDDFMTGQENAIGTFHQDIARFIEAIGVHVIVFRNSWEDVLEQIEWHGRSP